MKQFNRDLLYCLRNDYSNRQMVDQELEWLHSMLRKVERAEVFCNAHEVIDLNRYRINRKSAFIMRVAKKEISDKYLFLFNKN
jgi:hypothetical protein